MQIQRTAIGFLLWGLGMIVLLVSCSGPVSSSETRVQETSTPSILIVMPNPTDIAATLAAQPDWASTVAASNAVTLTTLMQTRVPTPLATPPPNGTGIIPGKTNDAQVRELLGAPSHVSVRNGSVYWDFQTTKIPRVTLVVFEQGVVSRIEVTIDSLERADSIVNQYGIPTLVGFIESLFPENASSTSIRMGYMFYPSQGIQVFFDCFETPDSQCHGISKQTRITRIAYFVPMSIEAWLSSEKPERQYRLAPWSGFSPSTP